MSADVVATFSPTAEPRSSNPFEAARLLLIKQLLGLKAPKAYPCAPSPADHMSVADHLREAAQIFDTWLAAVGAEVRDNATTSIDKGLFAGSFEAAIDGNETFVCESEAHHVADEMRAIRRAS